MIDEEKTFKLFGYYSSDLTPKSGKKIVCICNDCGKERVLGRFEYVDLCRSCSLSGERNPMFGEHHSIETKDKISKTLTGKYCGKNNPMFGKHLSIETKQKISKSKCGENHPNYIDGKWRERSDAKRRGFPKPELFFGDKYNDIEKIVGHHFNEKIIIYIPERLHQTNTHNLRTGKGMLKINMLALIYLLSEQ